MHVLLQQQMHEFDECMLICMLIICNCNCGVLEAAGFVPFFQSSGMLHPLFKVHKQNSEALACLYKTVRVSCG